jgi:hypothetical protein
MALDAKGDKIIGRVITQLAARPNVMDLKILHAPARLASPAVSLQNFPAKLAIRFRLKPQPGPLCSPSTCHGSSRRSFLEVVPFDNLIRVLPRICIAP